MTKKPKISNWRVRTFDEHNRELDNWLIKDQTESEATNEALRELSADITEVFDWELTEEHNEI